MNGMRAIFAKAIAVVMPLVCPQAALAEVAPDAICSHIATAKYKDCSRIEVSRCEAADGVLFRYDILDDSDDIAFLWDERTDQISISLDWTANGGHIRMGGHRISDVFGTGNTAFDVDGEVTLMGITKPILATFEYRFNGTEADISGITYNLVEAEVTAFPPPPMAQIGASLVIAHDSGSGLSVIKEAILRDGTSQEDDKLELDRVLFPGEAGFDDPFDPSACVILGKLDTARVRSST